ncbi:hypothetical protein ABH935_009172 [Catenulispora sp. GAS73]|uniref:hypothetical protein n=1 Tax=Catenulispora sp. GAS73 TaxID=3156269 RepID=UPI003516C7DD
MNPQVTPIALGIWVMIVTDRPPAGRFFITMKITTRSGTSCIPPAAKIEPTFKELKGHGDSDFAPYGLADI